MCSEQLISLFYYILSECQVIFFNYSQVFLSFTVNDVSPLVVRVYGIAGRAPKYSQGRDARRGSCVHIVAGRLSIERTTSPREASCNIPRKV